MSNIHAAGEFKGIKKSSIILIHLNRKMYFNPVSLKIADRNCLNKGEVSFDIQFICCISQERMPFDENILILVRNSVEEISIPMLNTTYTI